MLIFARYIYKTEKIKVGKASTLFVAFVFSVLIFDATNNVDVFIKLKRQVGKASNKMEKLCKRHLLSVMQCTKYISTAF